MEEARLPTLVLVGIILALALIFLLPFSRRNLGRLAQRFAERWRLLEQWQELREAVKEVMTPRITAATMGITILALFINVVILDLSLRESAW